MEKFDLTVAGEAHLQRLEGRACVIVSNHIRPHDSPMGPLARLRILRNYQFSADSFLFHRAVREWAGRPMITVAMCDRGDLSPRPWKRILQHRIGQPFSIGQMEALPGFIPVESRSGSFHRRFLSAVKEAVRRREAILIFPGPIHLSDADDQAELEPGAAHIAGKFCLPIVPACIAGSESWWPGQAVRVAFGEPFFATGMTKGQVSDEIVRRVRALHAAHGADQESAQTRRAAFVPDSAQSGSPPPGWVLPPTK